MVSGVTQFDAKTFYFVRFVLGVVFEAIAENILPNENKTLVAVKKVKENIDHKV